jgi:hypothetical protein
VVPPALMAAFSSGFMCVILNTKGSFQSSLM